jgi:hypothetical protein
MPADVRTKEIRNIHDTMNNTTYACPCHDAGGGLASDIRSSGSAGTRTAGENHP